ncbi:MAG: sigma-54 dependent transcriptional regulator [Pseudomonadota bacterium]|nr:MAG: Fis family transcriptional regulator [Pseudomonadota bacterium]
MPPVLTLPDPAVPLPSPRAKAMVFEDPRSRQLLERIRKVAPSNATVLIEGETGTGKEIVARHLHELSPRRGRPFVAVNCGAISENLIESELFGHERGAFTGAGAAKPGWFEAAHQGTLFLDEIGELSLASQVKLLRVLQESEVVRVGSRRPVHVDVRLIAATNVDLTQAMAAGRFREDLYYRLNVAVLRLPPLRERPGDILPLAEHFLRTFGARLGVSPAPLGPEAARRLLEHTWPGNIRELENAIHHALLVCQGPRIQPEDLGISEPPGIEKRGESDAEPLSALERALIPLFERNLPDLYQRIERLVLRSAFEFCERNQVQTARLLGLSRNIVRARLLEFGEIDGARRSAHVGERSTVRNPR